MQSCYNYMKLSNEKVNEIILLGHIWQTLIYFSAHPEFTFLFFDLCF